MKMLRTLRAERLVLVLSMAAVSCLAGTRTVSPDGRVAAEFALPDGQPSVAFSYGGEAVGRMTVGPDLGLGDFKVLKTASGDGEPIRLNG